MTSQTPPVKRGRRRFGAVIVLAALCAWMAFGLSGVDQAAVRSFEESAEGWQRNPEFRTVAIDYCVRGSRAMRARLLNVSASTIVLTVRSAPFIPERFAVNATSKAHYENFSKGPLSAYLHL